MTTLALVLAALAGYLVGSVPFGLLLGRWKGVDVRTVGSGNIGATNVGRALGRPWALVAFACDFGKGWLPAAVLGPALLRLLGVQDPAAYGQAAGALAGAGAVCGHVWPLYLRFRGGKGVATGCGAIVALDPVVFLGGGAVWLVTLALSRMVSLSSIAMGVAFPIVAALRGDGRAVVLAAAALTALVLVRHRANMGRMLAGTEPRIGRAGGGSGGESTEAGEGER